MIDIQWFGMPAPGIEVVWFRDKWQQKTFPYTAVLKSLLNLDELHLFNKTVSNRIRE